MPKELLIKGGYVVTVDPELGDQPDGDVLVRDGVIVDGRHRPRAVRARRRSDRRQGPAGHSGPGRHAPPRVAGSDRRVHPADHRRRLRAGRADWDRAEHSADDVYAGTLWGALQALDAGITTIGDWAHNLQSPRACRREPARAPGVRDPGLLPLRRPRASSDDPQPAPSRGRAPDARRALLRPGSTAGCAWAWRYAGRASPPPERNAADFAFARDLGLPISLHVGHGRHLRTP